MRCTHYFTAHILLQKYKIFFKAQNKKPPTRERNPVISYSSRSAVLLQIQVIDFFKYNPDWFSIFSGLHRGKSVDVIAGNYPFVA
jgi:hypothetical protein